MFTRNANLKESTAIFRRPKAKEASRVGNGSRNGRRLRHPKKHSDREICVIPRWSIKNQLLARYGREGRGRDEATRNFARLGSSRGACREHYEGRHQEPNGCAKSHFIIK